MRVGCAAVQVPDAHRAEEIECGSETCGHEEAWEAVEHAREKIKSIIYVFTVVGHAVECVG
jgi:hypothetical protein